VQSHRGRELISTPPGKRRKKGVRKELIAFRCPDDLLVYIRAQESERVGRTDVILKLLQVARAADEVLGPQWWEVERRANVAGVPPGKVLGELALAALDAEKPKAPKKK
jgi:hypothetical protein